MDVRARQAGSIRYGVFTPPVPKTRTGNEDSSSRPVNVELLNTKQLPRERILLGRRIKTEPGLFALVARTVALRDPVMTARIEERLVRRHARQPVSLGGGIALPHAAVPGLCVIRAVFVRSQAPIPMPAPDGEGITDVLALLVPSPGLPAHYDLLMSLTDLLNRAAARRALKQARTAAEIQALFTNGAWH